VFLKYFNKNQKSISNLPQKTIQKTKKSILGTILWYT
jgi:hypothetical protein